MRRLLTALPRVQWLLRAGIPAGAVLPLFLAHAAGAPLPRALLVVVVVVALVAASLPASSAPAVCSFLVVLWWAVAVPDTVHPLVLAAAGSLVLTHVCAVLAALGPPSYDVERRTLVLWVPRAVLLWSAGLMAWLVGRAAETQDDVAGLWELGAAVAVVLVVAASVLLVREAE
jgi:hypothetical protein